MSVHFAPARRRMIIPHVTIDEIPSSMSVIGEDNTPHPIERVGRVGGDDTIQCDLRANQEDEERDYRP